MIPTEPTEVEDEAARCIGRYFLCTEKTPWRKGIDPTPVRHPKAVEVGEQEDGWPGGDIVTYECPVCKARWEMELPQ